MGTETMRLEPLEATMARGDAERADFAWRNHRVQCPKCGRRRERCRTGQQLFEIRAETRDALARCRELDKLPDPDQGTLF